MMQIVIDIPKYIADMCKECGCVIDADTEKVGKAIRNGTLLPKNHGDLIDVNRKITVSTYDEQYEEWGEETMTVLEALNKWSDEGVRTEDVIIPADKEGEDNE